MSHSKSVIKDEMFIKIHLEGTFNGHKFEIEGEGNGKPYAGTNFVKLVVTKGGPLPFGWHILSPQLQYGNKSFVSYPADIPDYIKLSFPEGFTWERIMTFEDGGVCCITSDISMKSNNCFFYDIKFTGMNFPPNGPVVQKKTTGWEPSTERLYLRDGVLTGDIHKTLKLSGGGHYTCVFKTIYRSKKNLTLPDCFYYVDTKLDIRKFDENYINVEQDEIATARHHGLK